MSETGCPCGSARGYDECCGPAHRGSVRAATAEQLMRSRYSAFARGDAAYLLRTWHPSTRPPRLDLDVDVRWYRLDVLSTSGGGLLDTEAVVEFRAFFAGADGPGTQHEVSRFVRGPQGWAYLDGVVREV